MFQAQRFETRIMASGRIKVGFLPEVVASLGLGAVRAVPQYRIICYFGSVTIRKPHLGCRMHIKSCKIPVESINLSLYH
jgi:hypothetical protein